MAGARLHVVWEGDFAGSGSIAHVNRELVRRLAPHVDLSVAPGDGAVTDRWLAPLVHRRLPRVDVVVRHSVSPNMVAPRVGRWIWMTPWEYGASVPADWLSAIERGRATVWVYSEWTRRQFVDSGVPAERVSAVPLGVETERFDPSVAPKVLNIDHRCRFLFVGRLIHRKGLDLLLEAYRSSFSATDDVALVIKPAEARGVPLTAATARIEASFAASGAPALTILPAEIPAGDLPGVYTASSALVHPYRGESFCLPIAEAMACGVPVIATDCGGASALATQETAMLVPSFCVHAPKLVIGGRRLSNFPHWQEASVEAIAAAMRRIYENPERARARAVRARELIATTFTWDRAAGVALRALERRMTTPDIAATPATTGQRAAWLDEANASFRRGELDAAAIEYHRCLGREALAGDRAHGRSIAPSALVGLGRVARERQIPRHARRFFRFATSLYRTSASISAAALSV
jgi:glycosyltransferase involved in cell wall biosynthesis